MTTAVGEDLARVTVISPTRRIDLALPGSTTLGELLPNIVRFAGFDGATTQEAVHAWVLQRLGEDPLDPNKLVSALNIRDGETLHLRHRESTMPDAAFDEEPVEDLVVLAFLAGHVGDLAPGFAVGAARPAQCRELALVDAYGAELARLVDTDCALYQVAGIGIARIADVAGFHV